MQDTMPWQFWVPVAAILWLILLYMILQNRRRIKQIEARPTSLSIFNQTTQRWEEVKPQPIFDQDDPDFEVRVDSPAELDRNQIYRETKNKLASQPSSKKA